MTFELRRLALSVDQVMPLSQSEYDQLCLARQGLFELLAVEEKYDLLLRNFASFERTIHESALTNLLFTETSWSDFIEHIQAINLALMNLLGMCRTYVDQIPQHLGAVFPSAGDKADVFDQARRQQYDSALGYRVLYALRNYVQHCGLPVHAMTFNGRWLEGREACRHIAIPFLSVEALEESDFKKSILDELRAMGERIDLRPLVRENMSAFGRLHGVVRELVKERKAEWDTTIATWRNSFAAKHGNELIGLAIVEAGPSREIVRQQSLFDDMIKRRQYLEMKNQPVTNAEKHFISGEVGGV